MSEPSTLFSAASSPELAPPKVKKRIVLKRKAEDEPASSDATSATPTTQQTGAEKSTSDEEKQRLDIAHLMVTSMQNHTDLEARPDDPTAPLHERFKAHIEVQPGSTLRKIENEIRSAEPDLSLPVVHAKAKLELKKQSRKNSRLQWQTNARDSAILPMLRNDSSPVASALVAEYEDKQARLSLAPPGEQHMQQSITELRHHTKKRIKATQKKVEAEANELLGAPPVAQQSAAAEDVPTAPLEYNVTSRATIGEPEVVVASATPMTESGLVVERNVLGDVVPKASFNLSQFGAAYAASKSRSEASVAGDATRFMARFHANTVNTFLKVLTSAPVDAMLTAKGERPSGSLAVDLRRVLEDNNFDVSALSNERWLKYLELWQQTHTPEAADVESALAIRAIAIDREKACNVMRKIGMTEEEVRLAMAHGKRAEVNAFLRCVVASVASEPFLRAEEQVEAETLLGKRVAETLKRAKKDAAAPTTTGARGREALGLANGNVKPTTPKTLGVSMEVVERAYIQSFMRPPVLEGEEECVRRKDCVCYTMAQPFPEATTAENKGCGFVAMQFLLPSEMNTYKTHGTLPAVRKLCVLCDRAATTEAVFKNASNGTEPTLPLHGYVVKKDVPGGYRGSMLLPPLASQTHLTGIVGPSVAFNPSTLVYSKTLIDGRLVDCIIETEMDFRTGSVSTPRI